MLDFIIHYNLSFDYVKFRFKNNFLTYISFIFHFASLNLLYYVRFANFIYFLVLLPHYILFLSFINDFVALDISQLKKQLFSSIVKIEMDSFIFIECFTCFNLLDPMNVCSKRSCKE